MSVRISIPSNLRAHTEQQATVEVEAAQVGEALQMLTERYPGLRERLFGTDDQLHSFVNVFVDGRSIRDLQALATPLSDPAQLLIVPALAGG